jgi:predicted MFS family arabinose efflux permease
MSERQVALGRMLFAIISGQMLGSVVSGFANVAFGWRSALFIASGVGAVAAIVAWTQMPATPRTATRPRRRRSRRSTAVFAPRQPGCMPP